MPGFRWGSFLGAIGQGEEQGQDVAERYRKMAEEQVARRAQDAVQNYLLGGPSQPAAPPPTPTPMPAVPGAMPPPGSPPGGPATAPGGGPPVAPLQSVAIPGAKPIAPPAPPPTMAPPPGPGAGAAPPPGGAGPPPGANSPAPPPAPSGGGGLPPPGSPQTDDPIVQSKATLQAIAKEIAAANPGRKWGHGELLDAVSDVLGQMDKVNPIAKQMAQLQLEWAKERVSQQRADTGDSALAEKTRHDQAQESDRAGLLAERIRHEKATEQTASGRAATYAEMAQFSHEDRQLAVAAANDRAAKATDAKERMQAQKDADTMERLDKALEDKDWATVAQITAGEYRAETSAAPQGEKPSDTARRTSKLRPVLPPPPRRTAGATAGRTAGAAPGYKSAADVVAAYKAKKLTHDQASQILRQNGWAN